LIGIASVILHLISIRLQIGIIKPLGHPHFMQKSPLIPPFVAYNKQ